jgi:hypothetical protein
MPLPIITTSGEDAIEVIFGSRIPARYSRSLEEEIETLL